jgi:plastocyanin
MGLLFQGVVASSNEILPTTHTGIDSSPIAAVITISKYPQGSTVYDPQNITIKTGDEILIQNNDTTSHTFTNGGGLDDPLLGNLFNVEAIQPKDFAEYVSSNLQSGTYPFFSASDPNVKDVIVVTN